MKGADEYSLLFNTGRYGRLYIVSGKHARGKTFEIYVLPREVGNEDQNPHRSKDAVLVYGVISGNPGWDEVYGWIHEGKWKDDFLRLAEERKRFLDEEKALWIRDAALAKRSREERIQDLLKDY